MTQLIVPAKSWAVLAITAVLDVLAMITSEQLATWFQLGTLLGICAVAFLNQINASKSLKVAAKTAEVTDKIHTLSNSSMQAQLRIVWLQAKRIAEMTKAKVDIDIASEAEKAYLDHQAKQAVVDSGDTGHTGN